MSRLLDPSVSQAVDTGLRQLGFKYVTVDLRGYRLGSLNEGLKLRPV
jgi:uncharacterized protein